MVIQLIADSGSTKTDWCIMEDATVVSRFNTSGINPVTLTRNECMAVIEQELLPRLSESQAGKFLSSEHPSCLPLSIHYYGAGCKGAFAKQVEELLQAAFPTASIEVSTDLLGAARALFGGKKGVACILGTGANSGLYDGHVLIDNVPPLGFILGDEGSGAALGKSFVNALYKCRLPMSLRQTFEQETGLTLADIIQGVYRTPRPNRFLASLSPFIHAHSEEPSLQALIIDNFRIFFRHNLTPYQCHDLPVGMVGSIASLYSKLLKEAAEEEGWRIATIVRAPMDGLIKFHTTP